MKDKKWLRLLTYVTGLMNQELLLQNEYLAAKNRILRTPASPIAFVRQLNHAGDSEGYRLDRKSHDNHYRQARKSHPIRRRSP